MTAWRLSQSLFPPSDEDARRFLLARCRRLLPHAQDTGGFFVALLHKAADAAIAIDPSAAPLLPTAAAPQVAALDAASPPCGTIHGGSIPAEGSAASATTALETSPALDVGSAHLAHLAEIERLAALTIDDDDDDDAGQPAGKSEVEQAKGEDGGEGEAGARERAPYSFFQFTPVEAQTEDMRQLAHFYALRDGFPWSQVTSAGCDLERDRSPPMVADATPPLADALPHTP